MNLARTFLCRNGNRCANLFRPRSLSNLANAPLYELRIYQLFPKDMAKFMELTKQWIHLRTEESPMLGYWFSELGGLNEAISIWPYDTLSQRALTRQTLAKDESWVKNYISKMFVMLLQQNNTLLKLKKGTQLQLDNLPQGGVYELQALQAGSKADSIPMGSTVIGTFQTVIGSVSSDFHLLHHSNIENVVESSPTNEGGSSGKLHTRMMIPAPWSPLS